MPCYVILLVYVFFYYFLGRQENKQLKEELGKGKTIKQTTLKYL